MIEFTKDDFMQWRSEAVTKRVMLMIAKKIEEGKEELSHRAGDNPITDREMVGKLNGLRDVLGVSYYELEDDTDEH